MRHTLPALGNDGRFGLEPLSALRRQMDRLFEDFGAGALDIWGEERRFLPEADYAESDKEIVITAELPGVDPKDVDISLVDDILTIRGEKRSQRDEKSERYQLAERSYGIFERSLSVPHGVDPDKIKAEYDKGVLKVTLPKPAEMQSRRRKIEIRGN